MTEDPVESLWWLAASPAVWAVHFAVVYGLEAAWCAKVATDGRLGPVGPIVATLTVVAMAVVLAVGLRGWRRHKRGEDLAEHDFDSAAGRTRFLGFSTFLLSALAAVAMAYEAMAVALVGSCG